MGRRDLMIMFEVVLGDWFLAKHVEVRDCGGLLMSE